MTEKLLPCPFCGEEPKKDYATLSEVWTIRCNHEDCDVGCEVSDRNEHAVIEVWNTRRALAPGEMQYGCPYIDGDECLLEKHSFGPCLCANPVAPTRLTRADYDGLRDAAALEIWHRFADSGTEEWTDETHKAEYLMCADAILAHTFSLEAVSPSTASSAEPWAHHVKFVNGGETVYLNRAVLDAWATAHPDHQIKKITALYATPPSVGNADAVRDIGRIIAKVIYGGTDLGDGFHMHKKIDADKAKEAAAAVLAALSAPVDGAKGPIKKWDDKLKRFTWQPSSSQCKYPNCECGDGIHVCPEVSTDTRNERAPETERRT